MRAFKRLARRSAAIGLLLSLTPTIPVAAGFPSSIAETSLRLPITSLAEQRWERVVRQRYDFSCGSAAVATLLTYHYGQPTTEAQVFKPMYRNGDPERIRSQGFSMLDMKRYLDQRGFNAGGFRMGFDDIARIGVPVIGLVNTRGYRHFVVVKGIRGDEALVGDPASGTVIISRDTFDQIWTGTALGARAELAQGKKGFNAVSDWAVRPPAPLGRAIDRGGLGFDMLSLPGRNEFGR